MPHPPPSPPFSPIREIFPDVFHVEGGFHLGPGLDFTRNMTILRQGGELTLVNSVRLSPEREAELDKLGKVKHLLRTGHFHGIDDAYYVERYRPTYWAPTGIAVGAYPKPDRALDPGSSPVDGAQVFRFEKGKVAEVAILLEREGGVLITCDSYQNWTKATYAACSLLGRVTLHVMGFQPEHVGGPWTKAMGRAVQEDFDRLLALPFAHLLPAHGEPLLERAKPGLENAVRKRFGG